MQDTFEENSLTEIKLSGQSVQMYTRDSKLVMSSYSETSLSFASTACIIYNASATLPCQLSRRLSIFRIEF